MKQYRIKLNDQYPWVWAIPEQSDRGGTEHGIGGDIYADQAVRITKEAVLLETDLVPTSQRFIVREIIDQYLLFKLPPFPVVGCTGLAYHATYLLVPNQIVEVTE